MKREPELLILEGKSAVGSLVKNRIDVNVKIYYIYRKPWYYPISIWNSICNAFGKLLNLFK